MRVAWIALALVVVTGCGKSNSEFVAGKGLPVKPADPWKPHDPGINALQQSDYDQTTLGIGRGRVVVLVADTPEKRQAGLAFINTGLHAEGMLFQLSDGLPRLDFAPLAVETDIVLADVDKRILRIAISAMAAEAPGTKYVLVLPSGTVAKTGVAEGQSLTMSGGIANAL